VRTTRLPISSTARMLAPVPAVSAHWGSVSSVVSRPFRANGTEMTSTCRAITDPRPARSTGLLRSCAVKMVPYSERTLSAFEDLEEHETGGRQRLRCPGVRVGPCQCEQSEGSGGHREAGQREASDPVSRTQRLGGIWGGSFIRSGRGASKPSAIAGGPSMVIAPPFCSCERRAGSSTTSTTRGTVPRPGSRSHPCPRW
jgi:hypothetical protein